MERNEQSLRDVCQLLSVSTHVHWESPKKDEKKAEKTFEEIGSGFQCRNNLSNLWDAVKVALRGKCI